VVLSGDGQTHQSTGIVCSESKILEARKPYRAGFWIVCAENGQFGANWDSPEHFGLCAYVDRASRDEPGGDDLRTPEGSLKTGLQQSGLGLDIEDIAAKLTDISIVSGVHVDTGHAEVMPFDEGKGVCEDGTTDGSDHRDVRVELSSQGVETVDRDGIQNGENALVFSGLNFGACQVLGAFNQIEPALFDLGQRDLGVGGNLEQGEDHSTGFGDGENVFAFFTNHVRGHVRVFVIDWQGPIRQLFHQEGLPTNRRVITASSQGLGHGRCQLHTTCGGLDEFGDDALFYGVRYVAQKSPPLNSLVIDEVALHCVSRHLEHANEG